MTANPSNRHRIVKLVLILILQVAIFAFHTGRGFITDDFVWLENGLNGGELDFLKPFSQSTGFYRPLVSLSFGLQNCIHGTGSLPYGWFNLLVHLLNILLLYFLIDSFRVLRPYALWVVFLFSMNIKVNSMAVGWISGRTTLLVTFFGLLTFYFFKKWSETLGRGKSLWVSGCLFVLTELMFLAALFSKESALMIPLAPVLFLFLLREERKPESGLLNAKLSWRQAGSVLTSVLIFFPPILVYFWLRFRSDAFTPFNAPDCYRFKISIPLLLKNGWEYLSRAGLLDIIGFTVLLLAVLVRGDRSRILQKPDGRILGLGMGFFFIFLIPVIFLPVRSDLYAYFPQIGFHLTAAVLLATLWRRWNSGKVSHGIRAIIVGLIVVFLGFWLLLYFNKAGSYGKSGQVSSRFFKEVSRVAPALKNNSHLVIVDLDEPDSFAPSRTVAYGLDSALKLFYFYPYKRLSGEIVSPRIRRGEQYLRKRRVQIFFWHKGRLVGPLSGARWIGMFSRSFPPGLGLPKIKIDSGPPGSHRLTRLQRHRLGIKWMRRVRRESRKRDQTP